MTVCTGYEPRRERLETVREQTTSTSASASTINATSIAAGSDATTAAEENPSGQHDRPVFFVSSDSSAPRRDRRKLSLQSRIFAGRRQTGQVSRDDDIDSDEDEAGNEPARVEAAGPDRRRKCSLQLVHGRDHAATLQSLSFGRALKHIKRVVFSSIGNIEQTESCSSTENERRYSLSRELSITDGFGPCEDDENVGEKCPVNNNNESVISRERNTSVRDSMLMVLSALYCKLLVVVGLALPLSEIISAEIPPLFFHGFYIYLYGVSVIFLLFVYSLLLKDSVSANDLGSMNRFNRFHGVRVSRSLGRLLRLDTRRSRSEGDLETASHATTRSSHRRPYMVFVANYGSFYLRSGAVLFGIGSMIYSGLEFGQFFDMAESCQTLLIALTPALKLTFTFIQMYFIFLNASMSINRHKILGRFGLMHMVATNLCVWLHVVIEETKHELFHLVAHHGNSTSLNDGVLAATTAHGTSTSLHHHHERGANYSHHVQAHAEQQDVHHLHTRSATGSYDAGVLMEWTTCGRSSIMGNLVNAVSPFLFPCSIEYSLICAATLYIMWKHLNKLNTVYLERHPSLDNARKHHYSVDCASASKGLFLGILVFVATVISLILFFVLIDKESTKQAAIKSAGITELVLYTLTSTAIIIGTIQVQKLSYHANRNIELDTILLVAAQTGIYLYACFDIIGAYFSFNIMSLITGIMSVVQVTLQTMFILDTTHRQAFSNKQVVQKPGREVVTFLLISNLAMWAMNTFETSRSYAHPEQLEFYGIWAWAVISHVSMPLAIFYRFHCTVCLCEVWKRAYKQKQIL